ncbi:MAG: HU family DNA-binding protein [Candidatus Cloacimonetes bacterium]|nr:HU family DNA-binding protein [Candidatus Cloacimonadota bacterium]
MNKQELIGKLAMEIDIPKKKAGEAINTIFDSIRLSLEKEEKVTLVGFGSFSVAHRAARIGMNPLTKEKINIPATKVPKFKAGKRLKEAVK